MADLCTVAEVKEWLNISNSNEDGILTRLVKAASQDIRNYVSRDLDLTSYSEVYNGSGGTRLYLRNFPVIAVTSVSVDGANIPLTTNPVNYGFMFDSNMVYIVGAGYGLGANVFPSAGSFIRGSQNVRVAYSAGYQRSGTDLLPDDLRQACIEITALKHRRRLAINRTTETLAGQVTSYLSEEFSKEIKGVLDRYRRVVPV